LSTAPPTATLSATGAGTCYVYDTISADSDLTYGAASSADIAVTFTLLPQIITAHASTTSTSWANTSTLSSSDFSGTGAITYALDHGTNGQTSSPLCSLTPVSTTPPTATLSATGAVNCYVYAMIASDDNYADATSGDVAVSFTANPDLSVTNVGSQNVVLNGNRLTYTVSVTNTGNATAYSVALADALPSSVRFDSVRTSQGTCRSTAGRGGSVLCILGNLGSGQTTTVTIVVTTTTPGTFKASATVTGYLTTAKTTTIPSDPDDTASATTTVLRNQNMQ
jgi:uncharacterized repeat protein (TIGR01451 family)